MKTLTKHLKGAILLLAILPSGLFLSSSSCYGQKYQTIKIGTQEWMVENLNVSTFRNGDPIPEAKTLKEFQDSGSNRKPAWCYYNNDSLNGRKYGKLYNWYAISDPRGLAPTGWHISGSSEWSTLILYLGGDTIAGLKMKSTSGWKENGNGNNISGFSGLPAGYCDNQKVYIGLGESAIWWTGSGGVGGKASVYYLTYLNKSVSRSFTTLAFGFPVRCLKDKE